jgi:Domain of unknown function (DUF4956)
MTMWSSLVTSAVALCVLTFGMYIPRHHRGDLAAAFIVIGIGLAMIMLTLKQATTIGAGFGLGILGVLSVFRLRSIEIDHHDVAYFFATLSIGIIGGLTADPVWLTPVLCVGLLAALFVTDHPKISSANQRQVVLLDRVHTDPLELRSELGTLLNAHIHRVDVRKLDTLQQTTLVDVRFRANRTPRR